MIHIEPELYLTEPDGVKMHYNAQKGIYLIENVLGEVPAQTAAPVISGRSGRRWMDGWTFFFQHKKHNEFVLSRDRWVKVNVQLQRQA